MLGKLADLPDELGRAEALLADNGYFSESNVKCLCRGGHRSSDCNNGP
jgi:hypothetical protein